MDKTLRTGNRPRDRKSPGIQLQQSEEFVRLLLDSTAEAIIGIDLEGKCIFCNAASIRWLGYDSQEDLLHKNVHDLIHHTRADNRPYPQGECLILAALRHGEGTHVCDEVIWRANGTSLPVEYWSYPIHSGGAVIGAVVTFLDITERCRLEAQLRQAQKMDAIGRLAGGIAHDFNNLLMVITAYAELTLEALSEDDAVYGKIGEILNAGRRAAELTRQLLAFGRKQVQSLQVIDLNRVVREINKMLPRLMGEDIELSFGAGEELRRLRADPSQIEQILMNLAANARDAMPNGGTFTIETRNVELDEDYHRRHTIVPTGDYVELTVSDSGQGIPPDHLPHIFEPFYTTKEEGKGTGLGLATVYGIVKQNGGFIWVYSELGLGTSFKIYWPALRIESRLPEVPRIREISINGSETILLVEDEAAVRESSREFLAGIGYTVLAASNGDHALQVAREYPGPIDLMITDVVMPHLGGPQLAEQLLAERPRIKVLFVSGYAESTVLRHGAIDVRNCFLPKPFTLKVLARKIRQILEKQLAAAASSS